MHRCGGGVAVYLSAYLECLRVYRCCGVPRRCEAIKFRLWQSDEEGCVRRGVSGEAA